MENLNYTLQKDNIKIRKSNLEILKIISIIMIIMHHYAIYNGFLFQNEITFNRILINIFQMFGKLGVCLFIIISGYFYDKTKFKIKKLLNLILQVFVYAIIGVALGIFTNNEKLNLLNITKSIFPIIVKNNIAVLLSVIIVLHFLLIL